MGPPALTALTWAQASQPWRENTDHNLVTDKATHFYFTHTRQRNVTVKSIILCLYVFARILYWNGFCVAYTTETLNPLQIFTLFIIVNWSCGQRAETFLQRAWQVGWLATHWTDALFSLSLAALFSWRHLSDDVRSFSPKAKRSVHVLKLFGRAGNAWMKDS